MAEPAIATEIKKALAGVDTRGLAHRAKFVFAMTHSVLWKVLLFISVLTEQSDAVLMSLVGAAGAVETAFLGFQGWHDKHKESVKVTNGHKPAEEEAG
jgi:hypothetical protein